MKKLVGPVNMKLVKIEKDYQTSYIFPKIQRMGSKININMKLIKIEKD